MPFVASGQGENGLRLRLCHDGQAQGILQLFPPLRASEHGVVVCSTIGGDVENTMVVTFIDDFLDTFVVSGRRLTQGVLVDSVIYFAVLRTDSSIAEYDLRTRETQFYRPDSIISGRLPALISNFGSTVIALDLLEGPMIVNREQQSLEMIYNGNWAALDACEVFGVRDSIFVLGLSSSFVVPLSRGGREPLCPPVGNNLRQVSIIGERAWWVDQHNTVWSLSRTTRVLDSFSFFSDGRFLYMASVGKHGVLTATRSEGDSTNDELNVAYYSFDQSIIQHFQVQVCVDYGCYRRYDGIGWSNGTFYLTIGSPDSMMCIYSYKEPEPISSSVEEDSKELPASYDTSVVMSLHEFDAWRCGLASSYEMYDLYGNNITTSAVGVGVVFVIFDDHYARVLVVP
jgi:hypothetical protein